MAWIYTLRDVYRIRTAGSVHRCLYSERIYSGDINTQKEEVCILRDTVIVHEGKQLYSDQSGIDPESEMSVY